MKYSLALLTAIAVVQASPVAFPQGVTANISPKAPAPSGCTAAWSGSFGIVVQNITGGVQSASQLSDGQPRASSAPVSQISDGQPQASTAKVTPVSQISDGQPQATTKQSAMPITQISDGQIQATTRPTMAPVTQISDGQIQATRKTAAPLTQISDGQIQATKSTAAPVSQISDGQIQATTAKPPPPPPPPVSQISDGQIQATTKPAVSQISDGQPQATKSGAVQADAQATPSMVACSGPGVLSLTLKDGILLDNQGRSGYIASNYQFQFDKPAQAGAIYTSGWSVCGNGSLALGGSTTFYQCLSGNFYNLYDRHWAPQCNAVTIDVLDLISCAS